ncbi:triphosphoribosyl-dephospho-CoA synthase [Streptomyces sp. NPDC058527]|uniref:triphosphoribosyl-dephospho-CoA synthase n=1 Tax=unclassified Streptomyces TaxID=2593676 RepID=UPI00365A4440
MAHVDDGEVLRGTGPLGLRMIQRDARAILTAGGSHEEEGRRLLEDLDATMRRYGIRPAASGSLLAALTFLDGLRGGSRTAPR